MTGTGFLLGETPNHANRSSPEKYQKSSQTDVQGALHRRWEGPEVRSSNAGDG